MNIKNCPKGFRYVACPDCAEFSEQSWLDSPKGKCDYNGLEIEEFLTIDERLEMLAEREKYNKWREDFDKGPLIDKITIIEDSRLESRVKALEERLNPVKAVGKVGIET